MEGAKVAKLVQRCVADVARHPVEHVDVYVADDITSWHVALHYPEHAPFVGGSCGTLTAAGFTLHCSLQFDANFPAKPPRLKFLSPWMNHQHLWGTRICHSLLSDDFLDFFQERRTHGTSMWNAACAVADGEGLGGMPRYLQILREFLASDPDYNEEQHVRYDAESLRRDVEAQRAFQPLGLEEYSLLEPRPTSARSAAEGARASGRQPGGAAAGDAAIGEAEPGGAGGVARAVAEAAEAAAPVAAREPWGTDFFDKTPLLPGDPEAHPCFDVSVRSGRVPALATTMTSLCVRSFELGARTTDFGSAVAALLPHPCSRVAWTAAGSGLAQATMQQLTAMVGGLYALQLPGLTPEVQHLEAILGVVGELWKTTCVSIVKDESYESERAMMCFVSLHFLLLFLAEEHAGLREHATATARQFLDLIQGSDRVNLKAYVPDLGRFLVRFLLTEEAVPMRTGVQVLMRELFSRNVRFVDPDYWAERDAEESEKELQIAGNFECGQVGMKLTVFQSYYILRSAELGLNTLEALEACAGKPGPEALRTFQNDCREIKAMGSYPEFFLWLQLDDLLDADVHEMLCEAVDDSEERGYNGGLPHRQ